MFVYISQIYKHSNKTDLYVHKYDQYSEVSIYNANSSIIYMNLYMVNKLRTESLNVVLLLELNTKVWQYIFDRKRKKIDEK